MDKHQTLKHYFGHDAFRPGQETLIDALLQGRDALGVMPTGAGKSMCYQIPALMLPGITLVISPLISLMKDQVAALKSAGVAAAYLNSSLTPRQMELAMERAAQGAYRIIYVAPERLETASFQRFACQVPLALIAVDEAHCVSQWGQDFRPNYLKIADFIDMLPQRPPVGAFTATATQRVREDILRLLRLRNPAVAATGFDRPNLFFEVVRPRSKYAALKAILETRRGQSGIVYCATRKTVEEVTDKLTMAGFSVSRYHAGLSDEERRQNQEDFQYDRVAVMVATNAFGMGIDKSNVNFVIHYNMPRSMEAYYQEAGRAGRDGSDAACILLYGGQDIITARWMLDHAEPNPELTAQERKMVRAQDEERLRQMTFYCTGKDCLRASILRYFGQQAPQTCGACSRCTGGQYAFVNDLEREPARRRASAGKAYAAPAAVRGTQVSAYEDGEILMPLKPGVRLGHAAPEKPDTAAGGDSLFDQLRACRMRLAKGLNVPPYVIAADKTLTDMARKRPMSLNDMLEVYGMGTAKVGKYGDAFLQVIRTYLAEERKRGGSESVRPLPRSPSKPKAASKPVRAPSDAGAGTPWQPEEEERLRRGYLAGVSIAQLAAIHSRTEDAIRARLKRLHLIYDEKKLAKYSTPAEEDE